MLSKIKILIVLNYTLLLLLICSNKIISQDSLFQKISSMTALVDSDNLTNHIEWLQEPAGHNSRVNFTPGNDSAAAYIFREFEKLNGITSVELDTFFISDAEVPFNSKPLVNVIATFEGKTDPEKYYLLGAHFDASASNETEWDSLWQTIDAPGADDNATGVASILEIARIISDPANNFQNDYTLKFVAFGAEEAGPAYSWYHHGSRHYAQNAKANNHNILGMISIDLIGFNDNFYYQSITANANSIYFAEQILNANQQFNIELIIEGPPFSSGSWSDHLSFWTEGYPAVLMLEHAPPWVEDSIYYVVNPNLHTSNDTIGYLNLELVKKVTQLNLAAFASLSASLNLTGTEQHAVVSPENFSLYQNYPNPFNPGTKIKFSIPAGQQNVHTLLHIYDILGNKIETLVDEQKSAGIYEVEFDGNGLSSGIYFYTLQYGGNISGKKMILLK